MKLYVQDLWQKGDAATRLKPQDLRDIHPGYEGYFEKWWEDQRRLWGKEHPLRERTVQEVFNLLATAMGALTNDDLLTLADPAVLLDCAQALSDLAAHLPPDLLPEALTAAREIRDVDNRARALSALAPRLAELPKAQAYPLWAETLPVLAGRTRRDLLSDLGALALLIAALGGEQAFTETARAIQDVARWWP